MRLKSIEHVQLAMPPGREEDARKFYGALLGIPGEAEARGHAA